MDPASDRLRELRALLRLHKSVVLNEQCSADVGENMTAGLGLKGLDWRQVRVLVAGWLVE